jgi:nicotinamidase-related amidase
MSRPAGGGRAAEMKPKVRALLILNVQVCLPVAETDAASYAACDLISLQNDFFCDGSCPLPGADAALKAVNELRTKRQFNYVFVVGYHRTSNHMTFSTNHPGTRLLENVSVGGGTVTMMPDYCLQGSWGSKFHKDLIVEETDVLVHYGFDARVDQRMFCWSAVASCKPSFNGTFAESALGDRTTNIASIQYTLSEHDVEELYIAGVLLERVLASPATFAYL